MKKHFYLIFHIGIVAMSLSLMLLFALELRSTSCLSGEVRSLSAAQGASRIRELQSELNRQKNENSAISSRLNELEDTYSRTQTEITAGNGGSFA